MNENLTLKSVRAMRGLSQSALAGMIGVDRATIINWEKGRTIPTVDYAIAIADALAYPINNIKWVL